MSSIYIGFDPREYAGFAVARYSVRQYVPRNWPVRGLVLSELQARGLYTRKIEWRASAVDRPVMWDVPSDAPMSTQHANARFLIPEIAGRGWALFMDGDMLVRAPLGPVFEKLDPRFAVYCVKHRHVPTETRKMDGQVQTAYARKNWSSFMIFNCDHPAHRHLTPIVNTAPGRDLHRFCWLKDEELGELPPEYNYLVGHTVLEGEPKVVHFTDGVPDMVGYDNVPFADEWRAVRDRSAL